MRGNDVIASDARWIWDHGEDSPRNAWRLFRGEFDLLASVDSIEIRITADTRYVLFVNGERIGQGPARGFPEHYPVDTWDLAGAAKAGRNVIGVLVLHYGVATFQSLRNRGGLLAEVRADGETIAVTDSEWRVTTPAGQDGRTGRMSCQLGFVESIDARAFAIDWPLPDFDDSGWERATEIGHVGTPPWTGLMARDIPPLQEQPVRPVAVEHLSFMRPIREAWVIDLRAQMDLASADHANQIAYAGYLATLVRMEATAEITLVFGWGRLNGLGIDGEWIEAAALRRGPEEQLVWQGLLEAGDHLVIADVSAMDHGHGFRIAIDGEGSFDAPNGVETPFLTIGPIGESPDPGNVFPPVPEMPPDIAERVRRAQSMSDLAALTDLVRVVPAALASPLDIHTLSTWPIARIPASVPMSLQRLASGVPVEVPFRNGFGTEIVVDFGRELSGYPFLAIDAPAGTVIDMFGFEYVRGDHRENPMLLDNSFRYITRAGFQRYLSPTRRGLRYLHLTIRSPERGGEVRIHDVGMLESHYPVAEVGRFRCSDARLDEIYAMSRRTVLACMEDTWVDCPAFEQTYWVGDAFNTARFATWLFGAEDLTARCLQLVTQSAGQSPFLSSQVPSGWTNVLPNWTFFWALTVREHWRRTGDTAFLREILPAAVSALERFLAERDERGLLAIDAWNLLDWAPLDQPNSGVVTHQNCILVWALRATAEMANAIDDDAVAARFAGEADALADAINAHLWCEDAGAYIDAIHADGARSDVISVHSQMFAVLADVPGAERREALMGRLIDPPVTWVQIASPWMSAFYYDLLADLGQAGRALELIRENYGRMLDMGATTCWEMYPESNFVAKSGRLTRSHCHAWSAAPARFLPQRVLGVTSLTPGWTTVAIRPEACGLTWAEGRVPLPDAGWIDVRWDLVDGDIRIDARAPEGIRIVIDQAGSSAS